MSKTIEIMTIGVRGGSPKSTTTGKIEVTDHDEEFHVAVDCYEGRGDSYKEREKIEIHIQIGNDVFRGAVDELKELLF
jgi:hypothetical protein